MLTELVVGVAFIDFQKAFTNPEAKIELRRHWQFASVADRLSNRKKEIHRVVNGVASDSAKVTFGIRKVQGSRDHTFHIVHERFTQ